MARNKEITRQRRLIEKLAKGIDPTSDIAFEEDTILNNPLIKKLFDDVAKSLLELERIQRSNEDKRIVDKDILQLHEFCISDQPITVSCLAHLINKGAASESGAKLAATEITGWLETKGYLETVTNEKGNLWKVPTEDGKNLGITEVVKINARGVTYSANLYNAKAQQFVIDNLGDIVVR